MRIFVQIILFKFTALASHKFPFHIILQVLYFQLIECFSFSLSFHVPLDSTSRGLGRVKCNILSVRFSSDRIHTNKTPKQPIPCRKLALHSTAVFYIAVLRTSKFLHIFLLIAKCERTCEKFLYFYWEIDCLFRPYVRLSFTVNHKVCVANQKITIWFEFLESKTIQLVQMLPETAHLNSENQRPEEAVVNASLFKKQLRILHASFTNTIQR